MKPLFHYRWQPMYPRFGLSPERIWELIDLATDLENSKEDRHHAILAGDASAEYLDKKQKIMGKLIQAVNAGELVREHEMLAQHGCSVQFAVREP